jgi:hypothetical protein
MKMTCFAKFGLNALIFGAVLAGAPLAAKEAAPIKSVVKSAASSPAVAALQLKSTCCFMMDDATGSWGDMEGRALDFQPTGIRFFDALKGRNAPPFTRPVKGFTSLAPEQVTAVWFQKTFAELLASPDMSAEALTHFNAARKNMVGQAYFSSRPGMPPFGPDLDLFINTSTGDLYYFSSLAQGRLKKLPSAKPAAAKK